MFSFNRTLSCFLADICVTLKRELLRFLVRGMMGRVDDEMDRVGAGTVSCEHAWLSLSNSPGQCFEMLFGGLHRELESTVVRVI